MRMTAMVLVVLVVGCAPKGKTTAEAPKKTAVEAPTFATEAPKVSKAKYPSVAEVWDLCDENKYLGLDTYGGKLVRMTGEVWKVEGTMIYFKVKKGEACITMYGKAQELRRGQKVTFDAFKGVTAFVEKDQSLCLGVWQAGGLRNNKS